MKDETRKLMMQLTPYEGKENYVFISYSHQDTDLVLPVLHHLQENGIRFWYDEGIDPGTEWPESIATHLDGCYLFLAFMSNNSLESLNCRNEINYALSEKKHFLAIILESVEMSRGMKLQMATIQFFMKNKYLSDDQFLDKLLDLELIRNCRKAQPQESAAVPTAPMGAPAGKPAVSRTYNVLMSDCSNDYFDKRNKSRVFGSSYTREQIRTVTFRDTLGGLPDDAWDVSEARDGSVMAWVKRRGSLLDLNIGAEGGVAAPADCTVLFGDYSQMISMDFNGCFDTAKVTDMKGMFQCCSSIKTLNLSSFDTAQVTNMFAVFSGCSSIEALDVSSFDTAKVTDMSSMFSGCSSIEALDLSSFDTANVTDMKNMFYNCSNLEMLNVRDFDTARVTNMSFMFFGCSNLKTLDLTSFDIARITNMEAMFARCGRLTTLHIRDWNTSNINTKDMFNWCFLNHEVVSAILSGRTVFTALSEPRNIRSGKPAAAGTSNVLMSGKIDFWGASDYSTRGRKSHVFGSQYIREQISTITFWGTLNKSPDDAWDVSEARDGSVIAWVKPNGSLFDLNIGAVGDIAAPADCGELFSGYECLRSIHFNGIFDTANVTDMRSMFSRCSSLETLNLGCFDTANVTNMSGMFAECSSLTTLELRSFNTANVINMQSMFFQCSNLTALDLSGFDTGNVTTMLNMFYECSSLRTLNLSSFDTAQVLYMACMFQGCNSLTTLDLRSFDTAQVQSMVHMFHGCRNLIGLLIKNWNTSKVWKNDMFTDCSLSQEVVSDILSGRTVSTT